MTSHARLFLLVAFLAPVANLVAGSRTSPSRSRFASPDLDVRIFTDPAAHYVRVTASPHFVASTFHSTQHDSLNAATQSQLMAIGTSKLAAGDTVGAVAALAQLAVKPLSRKARVAALKLAEIAAARRDDSQELVWRSLAFLQGGVNEQPALHAQLLPLYARVVAAHGTAPDALPGVLAKLPVPAQTMDLDRYLDRQWTALYDHNIPMSTFASSTIPNTTSGRLVVGEGITALQCSFCWDDDREHSAVTQRFGSDKVIIMGIHYFDMNPPSNTAERLLRRMQEWYPTYYYDSVWAQHGLPPSVIPRTSLSKVPGPGQWIGTFIDGRHVSTDGAEEPITRHLAEVVAEELRRAPDAVVRVKVQPHGDTILTQILVDSIRGAHARLALRVALIEDTVRVVGSTVRRLYFNVVRAAAQSPKLPLGLPLTANSASTINYTFNLTTLRAQLSAQRDSLITAFSGDKDMLSFYEPSNWQIDPARLHVVAFVQDLDTGDVLQAASVRVQGGR